MPYDKVVVLGLLSTKIPRLEPIDELVSRVSQAAQFVPLDRLALSPQCGFASSILGNAVTPDDQRRKLERLVEAAHSIWTR